MQRVNQREYCGAPFEQLNDQAKGKQAGANLLDTVRSLVPPKPHLKFVFGDKPKKSGKKTNQNQDQNQQASQSRQVSSSLKSISTRQKQSFYRTNSKKSKRSVSCNKNSSQRHGPPYRPTILSQKELFGNSTHDANKSKKRRSSKHSAGLTLKHQQQMHKKKIAHRSKIQLHSKGKLSSPQRQHKTLHMNIDKDKLKMEPKIQTALQQKKYFNDSTKCEEKQSIKTEVEFTSTSHADRQSFIQRLKFKHRHQASRRKKFPDRKITESSNSKIKLKQNLHKRQGHEAQRKQRRRIAQPQMSNFSQISRKQAIDRRIAALKQQQDTSPEGKLKKWKH